MKNIKNYRGIKILFGIFIFSLISCQKEKIEPEEYQVRIENNYFEAILVSVGDIFLEEIDKNNISSVFFLPKGKYLFTGVTSSQLKIESYAYLQGYQKQVKIVISPKGTINFGYLLY